MKINWRIQKKRGNHRPVLKYEIALESFEIDLAVPQVVVDKGLNKPPAAWRSYCYPGEDERGGALLEWYRLMTPSHKIGSVSASLTLPWRPTGYDYVDVKMGFSRLRRDFEFILRSAYDSSALDIVENLELTDEIRSHVASGVVCARFLAAAGF